MSVSRLLAEKAVTLDALLARFDHQVPASAAWVDHERHIALVAEGEAWRPPGAARGVAGWPKAAEAWRELVARGRMEGGDGGFVGPVLIGAATFDAEAPVGALWSAFGHGRLILPRRTWTLAAGRLYETQNRVLGGPVGQGDGTPGADGGPAARGGEGEARFVARVEAARSTIAREGLRKLVVARRQDVATALAPGLVLRRLASRRAGAFTFALAAGDGVFCGASPELLARLEGERLESVCLAGTAARGDGAAEDRRLGSRLQRDRKEREEHELVRQGVRTALERTCRDVQLAARPSVRALADVQHLATSVRAVVRPPFGLLDVVAELHPTPAVAGLPVADAVDWLRRYEGLDRGLYGGPVGIVTPSGDGVFAVALRSGLLCPGAGQAHLFAGCGIVAASDAGREWQESRLKLRTMAAALEADL